jgi:putative endopeptidase
MKGEPKVQHFSVDLMDRSVDPALDFYAYAVGNWLRSNPVPADKSNWGSFEELHERNVGLIHRILETAAKDESAPLRSVKRTVGNFYASAMDTARIEELGLEPIAEDVACIRDIKSVADVFRLTAEFHCKGVGGGARTWGPSVFFEATAFPDLKISTVYGFYLEQGGLSLPDRDYYLKDEFSVQVDAFRAHLTKAFGFLGEGPDKATASADTVIAIERKLASVSQTRTEQRDYDKNYHKMTLDELTRAYARTPWKEYLEGREVGQITHVIVLQPKFFESLDGLLQERPIADWQVYLRWHLLRGSAPCLNEKIESADFDFYRHTLMGQQQQEPRWERVATVLNWDIGEAVGKLYVEKYFPAEARARMMELVKDLSTVFRERLSRLDWMTEETRHKALVKFDRFVINIGHPERFRDYSSVRIDRGDYLGNHRRAHEFENHRQAVRVGGPVDRTEWWMTPPTADAQFNWSQNMLFFPAGILQPPFFDLSMDDAVNYGGIGAVIGHEITHGFDDQGRKFDADGNLTDWWTKADAKEFSARAAKVVEQYNAYEPLPGAHVNGALTLGENIADFGGITIAFEALQRRLASDPSRRKNIDGFTPEQRFFLSWAQVWKQNCREAEARRLLTIDPHSPRKFRVIGPVSNHPGFAKAFGIHEGSPMWRSSDSRVSIW